MEKHHLRDLVNDNELPKIEYAELFIKKMDKLYKMMNVDKFILDCNPNFIEPFCRLYSNPLLTDEQMNQIKTDGFIKKSNPFRDIFNSIITTVKAKIEFNGNIQPVIFYFESNDDFEKNIMTAKFTESYTFQEI